MVDDGDEEWEDRLVDRELRSVSCSVCRGSSQSFGSYVNRDVVVQVDIADKRTGRVCCEKADEAFSTAIRGTIVAQEEFDSRACKDRCSACLSRPNIAG